MRLFFNEIKGFIGWLLFQMGLLWLFFFIGDLNDRHTLFYFCFLTILSFAFCLLLYYLKRRTLFSFLKRKGRDELNEDLGNSLLARAVRDKFTSQMKENMEELVKYQKMHDEYLLFINQWVHYIKTPLSVIRVITQDHEDSEEAIQIQAESDKILHGVNMALSFARSSNFTNDLKFERLDLKVVVQDVINDLKRYMIKKQVYPVLEIQNDCLIYSDQKWLSFIIYQLLTNAIKYSHEGGKIRIYIEQIEDIRWLCIEDHGVGIPQSDQARVFDLFFTGSNGRTYGESTGIGLYLVDKICRKMGYRINLRSQLNSGCTIAVGLTADQTIDCF